MHRNVNVTSEGGWKAAANKSERLVRAARAIPVALAMLSLGMAASLQAQTNTADGSGALQLNTTGVNNSAFGYDALYFNTTGYSNTATGALALEDNGAGAFNTATGVGALATNGTGNNNVADGSNALYNNSGSQNTAIGAFALQNKTPGDYNIALGFEAGFQLKSGDNNILIGNQGTTSVSNSIFIGTEGTQTATYIAGVFDGALGFKGDCLVVAESTGQIGCLKSSARYKRDVEDMGDASDKLMRLRPVTFRYRTDKEGVPQYGLIAEEVNQVYPELVVHGADGAVESVAYQALPAMLLNEVQKQAHAIEQLTRKLDQKEEEITALQRQIAARQ